jgi:cell division protein FtsI/penicillin-binding protein 2
VTTLHLAMIASMLANRGAWSTPRLVRDRRSFLGEARNIPRGTSEQIAPREAVERVIAAMQAVVTHPKGTGRRAQVDGIPLALKTGTAGSGDPGYDGMIIGFAPADHPKIAFALVAENAGAAEFAAAKVAHDFVDGLRASGHL